MPHFLRYRPAGFLGLLGLLASAPALRAQTTPSTVYALGTVTQDYTVAGVFTYPAGSQTLATLNPGSATPLATLPALISGVTAGQVLVGIDARPSTGGLYALGLNPSTGSAQVYTLAITTPISATGIGAATATPVGAAITLDVSDTNRSNTSGLVPNVGFDFNPRVDRIRVVTPNGNNYRLNPNTGQVVIKDTNLFYAAGGAVPAPASSPYVGTAAYTNSALGVSGTTLYDIDVTNTNAVLSTQVPPNNGQLNTVVNVSFYLPASTSPGPYPITSPTIGLGLDIYYSGSANSAYLVEARYRDSPAVANRFTSNLYSFSLASTTAADGSVIPAGRATLIGNIVGNVPVYFADIAVAVAQPYTWLGTTSSAWGTGSNWSTGSVPTSTSNVFIPGNTPNQPVVSDAQQTGSITLGLGAVLTTADGGVLSVSGNFVNNDGTVAGSGSGRVALVGSAQQEIAGAAATNFRNLSVGSAGAFTSATTSVEAGLTLTGNLTVTDQSFTLRSSASTGTAYVVNNGGAVTGTTTVQRYIDNSLNSGAGYRHYSAPVTNTTLADLATSTYSPVFNTDYNGSATPYTTSPYPTVYGYSQAQYESSPATTINTDFEKGYFSPTAGTAWTSGTGYTVNIPSSETVDFVGTLATGAISTSPQGRSSKANAGWQLLGNPYPSALDWNQVAANGLAGINNAVYVFKSSGQYSGNYASYVNGQGINGGTNVVPLGQGFFVRTSTVGGQGNLNFQNSQRITTATNAQLQRTTADTRPQLLLALSDGTKTTQADVYFENGATTAFDAAFDAEAFPSGNGLVLASEISNNLLAINGLPALNGSVTVPLRVAVATAGTYTLGAANLANLPTGYHAYLRDASLNTYTDLATTPSVTVSLPVGTATGRFTVVFGTSAVLAAAPAALASLVAVYPNPAHGTAVLLLPTSLRGTVASQVELVNTLGQVVLRRTLAAGGPDQLELPLSNLATGIYTVRATTSNGSVARQLRVE